MRRQPAVPRSAAVLAVGLFVVGYGTNISTPFLVLYKDRLDLGDNATMAIFVAYVGGVIVSLLATGPLADRFGRKPLCVPFIALSGLASLVMVAGRDALWLLLLGRFLLGVVSGSVLAVGAAWLQELLGPGQELRAAVLTTIATYGGFGLGPLVSALLERVVAQPLVIPFVLHAVAVALILPFVARVPETLAPAARATSLRVELGVPPTMRPLFLTLIVPAAVWVFGFPSTSFALFPVLLREAMPDVDVLVAGLSGALTAWGAFVARPILNRVGAHRALPAGLWIGSLGYGLGAIAFLTDAWPLLLPASVLLGGASGTLTAGCLTILGEAADDRSRAAATSTFFLRAYPGMAMPLLITGLATASSTTVALVGVTVVAIATAMGVTRRALVPAEV